FNRLQSNLAGTMNKIKKDWINTTDYMIKRAASTASQINSKLAGIKDQEVKINYVQTGAVPGHQHGFHGVVSQPYLFVAGEAGPERVDVTPGVGKSGNAGGGGGGGGGQIVV